MQKQGTNSDGCKAKWHIIYFQPNWIYEEIIWCKIEETETHTLTHTWARALFSYGTNVQKCHRKWNPCCRDQAATVNENTFCKQRGSVRLSCVLVLSYEQSVKCVRFISFYLWFQGVFKQISFCCSCWRRKIHINTSFSNNTKNEKKKKNPNKNGSLLAAFVFADVNLRYAHKRINSLVCAWAFECEYENKFTDTDKRKEQHTKNVLCNQVRCYLNATEHSIWTSLLCNLQKIIVERAEKNFTN